MKQFVSKITVFSVLLISCMAFISCDDGEKDLKKETDQEQSKGDKDHGQSKNTAPVIAAQTFTVAENIAADAEIGTLKATDAEKDTLNFSIKEDKDALFEITNQGKLSLLNDKELDYETKTTHEITVKVSDSKAESAAKITIKVTDVAEKVNNTKPINFTTPKFIALDNSGTTVGTALADLNKDGNIDLVATNGSSNLGIKYGDGAGNFETQFTIIALTDSRKSGSLRTPSIADWDKDGDMDIIVASNGGGSLASKMNGVYMLRNLGNDEKGKAKFSLVRMMTNQYAETSVVGDMTGDGKPDLVFTKRPVNGYYAMMSYKNGAALSSSNANTDASNWVFKNHASRGFFYPQIVDHDKDGKGTLFFSQFQAGKFSMVNAGEDRNTPITALGNIVEPRHMSFADINDDGKLDLFYVNSQNGNSALKYAVTKADGSFEAPVEIIKNIENGSRLFGVTAGDVDNDGDIDIVVSGLEKSTTALTLLENNGKNSYTKKAMFPGGLPTLQRVYLKDLNKDGKLDVIVEDATKHNSRLIYYLNTTDL